MSESPLSTYAALRARRAREQGAAQKKAFARLTAPQILAGLSEDQKADLAVKLGVKAAPASAKATASKTEKTTYEDGLGKGFLAGRDVERARIREVAAVATERGQAIEGMQLLAETDLSAADIVAKLKSRNLLVEAMKARNGGAAR